MKRMHVHVSVTDINKSIRFYSAMFGNVEPTVRKDDYRKWELTDRPSTSRYRNAERRQESTISVFRSKPMRNWPR